MSTASGMLRILHVDDEPGFADMVAGFLEREDDRFDVETATSASDGRDRLADAEFDCIVSDYEMPGQNGIELLETIREDHPDLPFILYTGKGSEEVASDAISAGATDYLQKESGTDQYELLANRIRNAVEQYHATQRAAALDRVRTLVSDINQTLVRGESRDEIETRVCENISESDPYLFAWIGGVDSGSDRIEPRASAGIDRGYLDDITITADDSSTGQGPGGTAIRERRVAVSQNVADDPAFDPWREQALERGFRAVAAVPLEYRDTLYGELVVYAERPHAFDDDERELLAELGADIAHAIHGFETRKQLREERDRRRALFEDAPDPVIAGEVREDASCHRIAEVNDRFEEVFGYTSEDVIGSDVVEAIIPEDARERYEDIRQRTTAGESITAEVERLTADGRREFLLHVTPYGTDGDSADGTYAQYTDISELKERERAIEKLHSTTRALVEAETAEAVADIAVDALRDILELPHNGVHLYDESEAGLVPVAWTQQGEEIVGEPPTLRPGEGIAWRVFETGEPEIYDDVSTVPERYDPDTDVCSEMLLPLDDHGVLIIGSDEPAAFDETDEDLAQTLASHMATVLDRLTQQRELREYETLVETVGDPMFILDDDGIIARANEAMCEQVDAERETVVGTHGREFLSEGDFERATDLIRELLADPERDWATIEVTSVTATGDRIPAELNLAVLTDDSDTFTGSVGVVRDLTERKQHERKLTALHDVADDLTTSESVEEVCERTIEASEDILEFDLSAIDFEEAGVLRKQAISGDVSPANVIDMPVERGIAGKTFRTGESFVIDDLAAHPDADPQGPYQSAISVPIADHGVFQAVAERPGAFEEADLELAELLVRHTESALDRLSHERQLHRQNERLERFASVVSHDLRNPLNVAQGNLELAADECESPYLDDAAEAVDRSLELIDDLLTLAREGEQVSDVEAVDLAATLEGCWQNVETEDATLVVETDRTIRADANRLKQLLENLIRNAVEHGGEEVTVTVGELSGMDGFYVADDGPGIPVEDREKVLDAGYSTAGDGTGFGLNIVREIVEAHDWEITVAESETGGSRFEISGVDSSARLGNES